MTPQQAKQLLENPSFRAWADGKDIQMKYLGSDKWIPLPYPDAFQPTEVLNFPHNYRIKPEPRTFWIVVKKDNKQDYTCRSSLTSAEQCINDFHHSVREYYEIIEVKEVIK